NLAARLQSLAEPGTILISETTHRLVRGFFQVRPLGPLAIRGKSERVPAYEVLGRSELATPMAIASERGLTPLVGRTAELTQLEACYRRLGNRAQIVSVVGDAGAGKSRRVDELKRESFDAIAGLVLTESHEAPVVMTIEDLHWTDESSIELLRSLVVRLASARVMVLVTERPDAQTAWPGHVALTRIVLPRLTDDDVTAIIGAVAGAPLPAELEDRGLLHRKSALAGDEYRFGESVTQEVAYEGLLLKQRRQLHERAGLLLEVSPGEESAEVRALIAQHFARSDNRAKAVEALLRAAADAEQLPAYRTAADFYHQAWELAEQELAAHPEEESRRRAVLVGSLGFCRLTVIFGLPNLAEARRAGERARLLAQELGDHESVAGLCYFLGVIIMLTERDGFARGLELAEESLAVAERAGLKLTALRLSRGICIQYAFDGRFELARRAADWVVDELESSGDRERLADLYVSARSVREGVLALADDLDAAERSAVETYELAGRIPNRTVRSMTASALAHIHLMRGEYAEAKRWAEESLEIAEAIANLGALPAAAA